MISQLLVTVCCLYGPLLRVNVVIATSDPVCNFAGGHRAHFALADADGEENTAVSVSPSLFFPHKRLPSQPCRSQSQDLFGRSSRLTGGFASVPLPCVVHFSQWHCTRLHCLGTHH